MTDDEKLFQWLMNLPPVKAQAYFWNYKSRKQRKEKMKQDMEKDQK